MKKTLLLVVAVGLVLAAAPMAAATAAPQRVWDIRLDGYCDGLRLVFPSAGLGTTSTVDGDQTGCVTGGVFGQANTAKNEGYVTIPGFATFTALNRNRTWIHYGFNGNQIYVLNSGTWSFGTPLATGGVASNVRRAPNAVAPGIPNDLDLVFDGYCDGMHLVNPSAGLGTADTVDGNQTGCATEPLIGAVDSINQQAGTYVVTFDAGGGFWIQTAIFPNHTWIHYSVSGNLIIFVNAGTWSEGIARPGGRVSSTARAHVGR